MIQQCLEQFRSDDLAVLYAYCLTNFDFLARDRFGCCIVKKGMDLGDERTLAAFQEQIEDKCLWLAVDQFGNYVVQHLFTRSKQDVIDRVATRLLPQARELSLHKFGSNVIESVRSLGDELL